MASNETRTEITYHRVRADILSGSLPAGTPLQFAQLRDAYGASMGVLREALTRLATEGLATNKAQQGFRVVELTLEDLNDLTDSRVLIETAVLREAIVHADLEWETRVVSAHHRLERTEKHINGDQHTVTDAWSAAHEQFHTALLSAAPNKRLAGFAESLRAAAEMYRRWSMPYEAVKRDVDAEHRTLMELALNRDIDAASEALAAHLSYTRDLIVRGQADARQ
jgi:DNA-binding GntR family transcriptional regulator